MPVIVRVDNRFGTEGITHSFELTAMDWSTEYEKTNKYLSYLAKIASSNLTKTKHFKPWYYKMVCRVLNFKILEIVWPNTSL